ncbi:AEC family transporter [Butyrivibrio sp. AE2005]|uniref:AEC family transporter n=1 Tax=Butyrivibrio sp. AE2005 TaxID=1496722 RepID=UPI000478DE06|nr:AEC family transporter [Butyrivibrio sp. AE2005]
MSAFIVMQQMGMIVILVSVGIYLYKKGVVDNTVSKQLSVIVMDICNPALILASILTGNVDISHQVLLEAVILGVIFYAFLMIFGALFPAILGVVREKRRFYNLMVVYTNVGFIGIPVAKAILPDKAIIYVIVCNIMYSLLFYTHGISVLSNGKEKMSLKKAMSPGTIMALLSLVVCWFKITPPPIVTNSVSYIGNATVFLSMTLLGVSIARSGVKSGFKDLRIWGYIAIRMVLLPVAMFYILRAIGCDDVAVLGFCLMATMPVGNLPLIQSEKIGEDTRILSGAITVTTIVSMVTITVLMILFTGALDISASY